MRHRGSKQRDNAICFHHEHPEKAIRLGDCLFGRHGTAMLLAVGTLAAQEVVFHHHGDRGIPGQPPAVLVQYGSIGLISLPSLFVSLNLICKDYTHA
jgi:hypothetical protein